MSGEASVTITAAYGAGNEATAKVITGVKSYFVDLVRQVIAFHLVNSDPTSPQLEFELDGVTTFTVTVSGQNQTLVIS